MSKYNVGQKVRFRGDVWSIHSVIETLDPTGKSMYWVIKNAGKYDEDVLIAFETDLEGLWEFTGNCTCGADKVGHPAHAYYCDKNNFRFPFK